MSVYREFGGNAWFCKSCYENHIYWLKWFLILLLILIVIRPFIPK